jgi:hypothetical protein
MAIKDWEISWEQGSSSYNYLWHKKNTYGNRKEEIGIAQDLDGVWVVDFFNSKLSMKESSHKCKSKTEALAFAKTYMRSH